MTAGEAIPDVPAPELTRSMGLRDVTLFMVTTGTNLQWVAAAAAAGPSSLIVWVLCGFAVFLPLSVCVVFLGSRHPDQGGLYTWSKYAFGPFAGFMTGWTYWTSNLPYFPGLLYFAAGNLLFYSGKPHAADAAPPVFFMTFAGIGLLVATFLNVRGLGAAKWLNNAGAILRWVAVIIVIILGIAVWWRFGSATAFTGDSLRPSFNLTNLIFFSTLAFAWSGPEAASFMAGEIRNPQVTIPRALLIAAPLIAGLYLLGTASVLVAIPRSETSALYGVMEAVSGAGNRLGVPWIIPLAAVCVAITCIGSVCAWLGAVARIPFAIGIDSYLPKSFAKLHPRYGSPVVALGAQAAIAVTFAFLGQAGTSVKGAYDVLVSMMVLATMIPFVALFASAIKLSGGAPVKGEVHLPGGRPVLIVLASVGLIATLAAMLLSCVPSADEPRPMLAIAKILGGTGALLLAGGTVYVTGRQRARRNDAALAPLLP